MLVFVFVDAAKATGGENGCVNSARDRMDGETDWMFVMYRRLRGVEKDEGKKDRLI